ncbi:hypothetical protein Afil01_24000 [Actinorhabdospora filicis]|uniref:Tetratrico peptide repeat group 5 domain-containing protein n=1 Tax=Actinorhabdospora filicis TaxID=1785913 RepID=A0A9W6SKD2_9ACTN|nr:tetratricopeptide repeat protein [Actinorhabdospora filicis]GLZ77593.1 hypothetical protein Afil01_24000 [Actinorhabdospora filicis]
MSDWQKRVDDLYERMDHFEEVAFIEAMDALAAEAPDEASALFERAGARDAAGHEAEAAPLYEAALAAGLDEARRRQASIQLASTLRNLGEFERAVALLAAEREVSDDLDDAVAAFYALALHSSGRHGEALSVSLKALAPHLTRYRWPVDYYAGELR